MVRGRPTGHPGMELPDIGGWFEVALPDIQGWTTGQWGMFAIRNHCRHWFSVAPNQKNLTEEPQQPAVGVVVARILEGDGRMSDDAKVERLVGRDEMNLAEFPITLLTDQSSKTVKTLIFEDDHGKLTIT